MMPNLSQSNSQIQKNSGKKILSTEGIQQQQLIVSQTHEIEQILNQELSQNPALFIEEEPIFSEDISPNENDEKIWNQDFDKPYDEYETGERLKSKENSYWGDYDIASGLEQTVIENLNDGPQDFECALRAVNLYRISGALPEQSDPNLREDLRLLQKSISYTALPTISPTFEVIEESGNVQAHVVSTTADSLNYRKGLGKHSRRAKEFINRINTRAFSLGNLATTILEDIQGDFFCQSDVNNAMMHLIPLTAKDLADLEIDFAFKLDKKMISKLSDLLVASKFGLFPLGFFLPSKATIVRLCVSQAYKQMISTINDQGKWIKNNIQKRVDGWDATDKRIHLIESLLDIDQNDIKNARKTVLNYQTKID
jgi:DNA-directed RNA polymerase specialized sigma54-like protein